MSHTTTHDFLANEEEAMYWLSVFEALPDSIGSEIQGEPSVFIVKQIKAFAKVYRPIVISGRIEELIIN